MPATVSHVTKPVAPHAGAGGGVGGADGHTLTQEQQAKWGAILESAVLLSDEQKQQVRAFVAGDMHNPSPSTPVVQMKTSSTALPGGIMLIGVIELNYATKKIVRKQKRVKRVVKKVKVKKGPTGQATS